MWYCVSQLANQHLMVTVLLEYYDLFTACINIMLGTYYLMLYQAQN